MPRIGENPMKRTDEVYVPQRVTITTIVYIPMLTGYWESSLEVLKVCLDSLRSNTHTPFDLIVFDNASCPDVQQYLRKEFDQKRIQYLFLSASNVGKVGAWNSLLSSAPGEIIAYMDSDVFFYPGWLEESLKVLEAFPKAAQITAQPARGRPHFDEVNTTTLEGAQKDPAIQMQVGKLIDPDSLTMQRYGLSLSVEEFQDRDDSDDILLESGGVKAFVSASHFQFISTKAALSKVLPFNVTKPLHSTDTRQMDFSLNDKGYWRLSTEPYLVHHLGNRLPTDPAELRRLPWDFGAKPSSAPLQNEQTASMPPLVRAVLKRSRVKKLLRYVNAESQRLLIETRKS